MSIRRAIAGVTLGVLLGAAAPASVAVVADPAPEARAHTLINAARTSRGLRPLARSAALDLLAERHSGQMLRANRLFHRQDLGAGVGPRRAVGENVGYGPTPSAIHVMLMGSRGHRANILAPRWDEVGLGIVRDRYGQLFETQIFVDR